MIKFGVLADKIGMCCDYDIFTAMTCMLEYSMDRRRTSPPIRCCGRVARKVDWEFKNIPAHSVSDPS